MLYYVLKVISLVFNLIHLTPDLFTVMDFELYGTLIH